MSNDDQQKKTEETNQWLKHCYLLGKVNHVELYRMRYGFITAYDPERRGLQELKYPNNQIVSDVYFQIEDSIFTKGDLVVFKPESVPEDKKKGNNYRIQAVRRSVQRVEEVEFVRQEILDDDLVTEIKKQDLECIFPYAERVYVVDKYARKIQREQKSKVESYVRQQYEEKEIELS